MSLKTILFADLTRQYLIAGRLEKQATFLGLLKNSFSPRFMPVVIFRLSHWFLQRKLSPFAKIFGLINFVLFGLEIAARCEIGPGLYFPHTQGTVIGANKIGDNATIYHNVTFGAREIDLDYSVSSRPSIGDNVIIGAGAKILGPVTVGSNARVGANAVVVEDVPAGATVVGIPARIVKQV
ncbi:Serine acetyltransferase [Collimonas arenae]|uniref:Serine acetyltransferase n=1 Tax=Collimonas arenae TaxID=279058 RepID=A0A0A1F687_9BURK|nr:serine O-acetyltransferase [Collimonas arenae]AIY40056.1 Serine acetyltransferase [Collimonas arenae]